MPVVVKIGIIGDTQTGKRCVTSRYIDNVYAADKLNGNGLCYDICEKTIELKNVHVILSIWTLSAKIKGDPLFENAFSLVCQDVKVIIFTFDLTNSQSLYSIKQWYKSARQCNKIFLPFLVGTKYDMFHTLPFNDAYRSDVTNKARYFAIKMNAPLVYCSARKSVNIKKIFRLVVAKTFDIKPKLKECHDEQKEALIEYENLFYYKASQKRIDTVLGYIRSFDFKYSMRDIANIILLYYGPNRKKTNQEENKRSEKRHKQKTGMKHFISGYTRTVDKRELPSYVIDIIVAYFTRKELKPYQTKKKHKKHKKKRKSSK